jgi:sterol desaturase/sphingolipid hydroxylase (fatty acid hydroxylase superfamily)
MSLPDVSSLLAVPGTLLVFLSASVHKIFLSPGGTFSLASLASALAIAVTVLLLRRKPGRRLVRPRALARAIFPRRIIASASMRLDIGLFLLNAFVLGLVFGWAILSYQLVSTLVNGQLAGAFGAPAPTALPSLACAVIVTVALFLAFELGYWLDHYLCHTVPFLWEFHKVHHTAEVLTPLTNYRVHPFDTLLLVNILALTMGSTEGTLNFLFGKPAAPLTLWSNNILILAGTYLLDHLHHTHFWIAFTGVWGKLFLSPAHHQIHHSTDPRHFNKNMGSCLALFDWLFGTLHMPRKEREKLRFGVDDPEITAPHSLREGLFAPVLRALSLLVPRAGRLGRPVAPADQPGLR